MDNAERAIEEVKMDLIALLSILMFVLWLIQIGLLSRLGWLFYKAANVSGSVKMWGLTFRTVLLLTINLGLAVGTAVSSYAGDAALVTVEEMVLFWLGLGLVQIVFFALTGKKLYRWSKYAQQYSQESASIDYWQLCLYNWAYVLLNIALLLSGYLFYDDLLSFAALLQ